MLSISDVRRVFSVANVKSAFKDNNDNLKERRISTQRNISKTRKMVIIDWSGNDARHNNSINVLAVVCWLLAFMITVQLIDFSPLRGS